MYIFSHRRVSASLGLFVVCVIILMSSLLIRSGSVHASSNVGRPQWWASYGGDPNTPCAATSYWRTAGKTLGAWYQGMEACGPIPGGGGPAVYTSQGIYTPGWQCVELSERWLTLAYSLRGVPADGWQVASNYSHAYPNALTHYFNNGTPGLVPEPGDVLSFTWNHTAVVTNSQVGSDGKGSITIIQENVSPDGWGSLSVNNWKVYGVKDWVHYISAPEPTLPPMPQSVHIIGRTTTSISLAWTAATGSGVTYTVFRNGSQVGTTSATTYTDTGLAPATAYTYQVQATSSGGTSQHSPNLALYTNQVSEGFVSHLYQDLFRRGPDASGEAFWNGVLATGTTRSAVANGFVNSSEYINIQVATMYLNLLKRPADSGGQTWLASQIQSGWTYEQARASLIGSAEYFQIRAQNNNDNFLTALYSDVLNRTVDSGGRSYWDQQLASGMSRGAVASSVLTSTEAYQDFVKAVYQTYLRRLADSNGLNFWNQQLQSGVRDEQFIASMVGSDEYENDILGNYVSHAYSDILHRPADSSGLSYWTSRLEAGIDPSSFIAALTGSSEYRTNLVAADYQQILHRSADADGSAFYVGQMNNGMKNEDVLVGLAASDEYFAKSGGSTNNGFVSALYQDLLQRAADPSGLAFWTQQLSNGVSRATVARGLVTSTEYRTKLVDGYYSHYLARSADPSGESYYVSVLTQGATDESVIAGLVASDEYYAKSQAA